MPRPVATRRDACRRIGIVAHLSELTEMGVSSVMLFGSIARDELSDASDVDVLVEFERPVGAFEFLGFQEYLETILGRSVDLATPAAIKPRMRQHVFDEAVHAA